MCKILIAITFMMLCEISLSQNIRKPKEVNEHLYCQNFSVTATSNSQVNLLSKNSKQSFLNWKDRWNQHPTRKIIIGSIFILLGADGIIEAYTSTNNYDTNYKHRIYQIEMTSVSLMLLSSGTVLLIRGINLKKQKKVTLTTSKNGIGLIYEI